MRHTLVLRLVAAVAAAILAASAFFAALQNS